MKVVLLLLFPIYFIPLHLIHHKKYTFMATTTKKTTKRTGQNKAEPQKKLSKLGEWRRAHPEGIMVVNDPAVLHGLSIYEIFN
jgi:hypothetical protein